MIRRTIRALLCQNKALRLLINAGLFSRSRGAALKLCLPVLLLCFPVHQQASAAESLTVVSYGGSYAASCVKAYHEPFTAATGIRVRLEDYNGDLAQIRAQVETGNVHWDVVDMEIANAGLACEEGLLESIDVDKLPPSPDGVPAREDYYPQVQVGCGAGTVFYSTIYAYDARQFSGEKPTTIKDFFDLDKFPGRRGMRRSPLVNLEFALMADGVPPKEVYKALSTREGLNRAYRKLDSIKEHVVWWETGAQPPQMLADGEVAMSTAYNGRIFNAQILEKKPFVIVWDAQVLSFGQLAIVAGTRNLELAKKFVRFASRTQAMADLTKYISYSPTRRSAEPLVSTHLETGEGMDSHLPNAPANVKNALHDNWEWWSDYGDEMNERFAAWLVR